MRARLEIDMLAVVSAAPRSLCGLAWLLLLVQALRPLDYKRGGLLFISQQCSLPQWIDQSESVDCFSKSMFTHFCLRHKMLGQWNLTLDL